MVLPSQPSVLKVRQLSQNRIRMQHSSAPKDDIYELAAALAESFLAIHLNNTEGKAAVAEQVGPIYSTSRFHVAET